MQGEKTDSEWEKIIANKATDKELISKIHKQKKKYIQAAHVAQYQKNKRPNQKMGQRTK